MLLKKHKDPLALPITSLINNTIRQCVFPKGWKSAIITPIFKFGNETDITNYRPISILPTISKIAEKSLAEQLIKHLNNSPYKLHPMQFGFRAKHSIDTANCFLLENIKLKLDKGGVVGAVFLDLRKAFNTVNHNILIRKMSDFNLSAESLALMKSYLEGRTQCVKVGEAVSPMLGYEVGVPQGSILGPLLFSLYINDLPSVCKGCNIQMYADDTVIYVQTALQLTDTMVHVSKWLSDSCLQLNVKKTICMFFTKTACNSPEPDVYVSGERLQIVPEYKYLGIYLDSNLSFKKQVNNVSKVVRFHLFNFKYMRNNLTIDTAKLYFNAIIIPYLTYCLTSWAQASSTTLKPIQILNKQALKILDQKLQELSPLCHFNYTQSPELG